MPSSKVVFDWIKSLLQWVGILMLLGYCATHTITVHLAWSAAYVALTLMVFPMLFAFVFAPALKLLRERDTSSRPTPRQEAESASKNMYSHFRSRPWKLLLAAGEDGVFFLPLLYVGINPIAALISSFVYAFMHYLVFPLWDCFMKWLFFFVVAMWILPHGIVTVVVGHVASDFSVFILTPHLHKFMAANSGKSAG
jgi:hypothetical protein